MTKEKKQDSQVKNPLSAAVTFGLGGAAVTAIGAAIRNNGVHAEAMTVLVGGVITGALAGSVGCCIPNKTEDAPLSMRICLVALETSLAAAAFLTAPLMGETVMQFGTNWEQVVVDGLIGNAAIIGGSVGLVAALGLGYGAHKLAKCVSSCSSTPPSQNAAAASAFDGVVNVADVAYIPAVVPANVNRV